MADTATPPHGAQTGSARNLRSPSHIGPTGSASSRNLHSGGAAPGSAAARLRGFSSAVGDLSSPYGAAVGGSVREPGRFGGAPAGSPFGAGMYNTGLGAPAYATGGASAFGMPVAEQEEEPLVDPEWARKSSRQRRFTQGTIPQLHVGEERVRDMWDIDDQEREENLYEMNSRLEDMSEFISSYTQTKEDELAQYAEMFDEEGNPIQRYDENGNPLPFMDEDGYSMSPPRKSSKFSVTFKMEHLQQTQGFLWKKGSGHGFQGRRTWARRYFKLDMTRPLDLYYFKSEPKRFKRGKYESESEAKRRRNIFNKEQLRQARGKIKLDGAEVRVPAEVRHHKDPRVKREFEFEIETSDRTYQLFAEDEASFEKWVRTFDYIISTIRRAKDDTKKRQLIGTRRLQTQVDEAKRDAALACTAFGGGLFECVAGQPAEFTIQACDELGKPDEMGGRRFVVVLESQDLHYDLVAEDNDDGTYTVRYTPTRVGTYELSIFLDDYDIFGSPFHPTVQPAPVSAVHCVAEGAGLFCAVVSSVNQFTIQTRNLFNQIVSTSGTPFEVSVAPPLVLLDNPVVDNG